MKIFAHRGASKEAPENSIEAFRRALAIGVDGVELDCLVTKDLVPIVNHDNNLSLRSQHQGRVQDKTWEEMRAIGTPALAQVLEVLKNSSASVIFDIKAQPGLYQTAPPLIAECALKFLPPSRILLSSFYYRHLWTLRRNAPALRRGLILGYAPFRLVPSKIFADFLGIKTIHPCLRNLSGDWVRKWQRNGFAVYTWVINTEPDFLRCQTLGVDGIFTDDPRLAGQFFKR